MVLFFVDLMIGDYDLDEFNDDYCDVVEVLVEVKFEWGESVKLFVEGVL